MSDVEVITACENVCRDFSWLENFIPQLASAAPIFAVIWGIFVFYEQRKRDRNDALRKTRQELYLAFLEIADQKHSSTPDGILGQMLLLTKFQGKFTLNCPKEVLVKSAEYIKLVGREHLDGVALDGLKRKPSRSEFDKYFAYQQKIAHSRKELLDAMRRDALQGSDVELELNY
ncbi:hypothetical protein QEZ52_04360 [Aliisedimentitalea scapharcae]|uniref:Uncharacterized protein n=1 Tax=Aliisedimentitalea scapharcae TaxID=1524259 RepID=A0ABZ2XVR3_9RHOB